MSSNMEKAFTMMWQNVYLYRKHATNPDGRNYWHIVKDMLGQYDDITFTWKRLCERDELIFMDREEFDSSGNTIEKNHFMMQLARLPQNGEG